MRYIYIVGVHKGTAGQKHGEVMWDDVWCDIITHGQIVGWGPGVLCLDKTGGSVYLSNRKSKASRLVRGQQVRSIDNPNSSISQMPILPCGLEHGIDPVR